jgi:ABC-type transporter Mla subunit MlaD
MSDNIQFLRALDTGKLARTSELGSNLDFSAIVPVAEQVVRWVKSIDDEQLARLPHPFLNELGNDARQFRGLVDRIANFSIIGKQHSENERSSLVSDFHNQSSALMKLIAPVIALTDPVERGRKSLDKLEAKAAALLKTTEDTKRQVEAALVSAREAAGL